MSRANANSAPGGGAEQPRARASLVPGRSLHGGMSGSRYDRVEVKPLTGASNSLGSAIKALIESNRERRARGTITAPLARVSSAEAGLIAAARTEGQAVELESKPAEGRQLLDRDHVDTIQIVFSLLDTGMRVGP